MTSETSTHLLTPSLHCRSDTEQPRPVLAAAAAGQAEQRGQAGVRRGQQDLPLVRGRLPPPRHRRDHHPLEPGGRDRSADGGEVVPQDILIL